MDNNTNSAPAAAQPAATSGDAPDLQQIKALALAAQGWELDTVKGDQLGASGDDGEFNDILTANADQYDDNASNANAVVLNYIAAANPAVVLDLIARIERAAAPAEPLRKAEELPATASGDELPSIVTPKFIELSIAHREAYNAHAAFSGSAEVRTAWKAMTDHIDAHTRAAVSAATKPTADLPKAE